MQQPTPHIVAKATVRDAIVALGAGYGFLLETVERRVSEYLRYEHLHAVGGHDGNCTVSPVECFDPSTNVWSPVASMAMKRTYCGVATV
jgi:Kelch motif